MRDTGVPLAQDGLGKHFADGSETVG